MTGQERLFIGRSALAVKKSHKKLPQLILGDAFYKLSMTSGFHGGMMGRWRILNEVES